MICILWTLCYARHVQYKCVQGAYYVNELKYVDYHLFVPLHIRESSKLTVQPFSVLASTLDSQSGEAGCCEHRYTAQMRLLTQISLFPGL